MDDDPAAIQALSRMLSQYPDQRFATSGIDAMRLAREVTPDLILLDADMPGLSGFDVCEALKADPALAHVPVIFATSHADPAHELAAFEYGAAGFVTKPLLPSQVLARVRAQLRMRRLVASARHEHVESRLGQWRAGAQLPRVLIVDDDVAAIHALRNALEGIAECSFARSGDEALTFARRAPPDLILLDAHMPGLDGFEVCAVLKSEPAFRHVPVVFVTRFSDPRNETRALDLGAADFINKPFTAAVLKARVLNLLETKWRTDAELEGVREHWRRVGNARVVDIVAAAPDAIVSFDAHDTAVLANEAACRLFGVPHEALIGQQAAEVLGAAFGAPGSLLADPARRGPQQRTLRVAGGSRPVEVSASRIDDISGHLTTLVLRDLTDRLQRAAESQARAEADTASRTQARLLAGVAQAVGRPLDGLLGIAQSMADDGRHPLAPAQQRRLSLLQASASHLQAQLRDLRDLLDLGHHEAGEGRVTTGPVDAALSVGDAVAAVSAIAVRAGATLAHPAVAAPLPWVVADAGRLHQCLVALLTHAIDDGQARTEVVVTIEARATEVSLAVRGAGSGLDAAQLEHLFEPFDRPGRAPNGVAGSGSGSSGLGLGLVITRQLARALGGRLEVESTPGIGSCFAVVLPRWHPGGVAPGAAP